MASRIETLEKGMARISVEIAKDEFKAALQQSFRKNQKRFNIPGFRKGKAPMPIVMNYYGESVLYDDALELLLQPALDKALKEEDCRPYSRPAVDIGEIGSDKGLNFSATFALKPEVELGEYRGVTAYCPPVTAKDEDIEKEIEQSRMRASRLIPVEDRPIADGDVVNMDYLGTIDGIAFQGGEAANYDLKIGSKTFIPGFEDQMIGHKNGESFDLKVSFPEDYHSEDLKGKEAIFAVTVNSVKTRELPELDDEFVKDVSDEYDTVDEWRHGLREKMEERLREESERGFEEEAVKAAVNNARVEIPPAAIHDEIEDMIEEQEQHLSYQGLNLDMYLQYMGIDRRIFAAQLREPAEYRLKSALVLDAVAAKEGLSITEEDLQAEIEKMAALYGDKADLLKKSLEQPERREQLKNRMLAEKSAGLICEHAEASDEPPLQKNAHSHGEHEHEHEQAHDHNHNHDHDHEHE